MGPIDSLLNGILALAQPLITPDWGSLIALLPYLLLLAVVAVLGLIARSWWHLYKSEPVRGPKLAKQDLRPKLIGHFVVIGIGFFTVLLSFIAGAATVDWTNAGSPFGLVVNLPLLFLGLALAIGAAGNAARLWDRNGRSDFEPDVIDDVTGTMRRHPASSKRILVFVVGVMLAAASIMAGTVPGPTAEPMPVAFVPVLMLGLAMAIWAVGTAIWAAWPNDTDLDPVSAGDETALVAVEH